MDRIMGVATAIAVVSMAKKHAPDPNHDNFGDLLIAEGGEAKNWASNGMKGWR